MNGGDVYSGKGGEAMSPSRFFDDQLPDVRATTSTADDSVAC